MLLPEELFANTDQNRFITTGGTREHGVITRVTSLADSGPGTLREAIETVKTANVIVFEVGGEIELEEDIFIRKSQVTIAGQTAPSPGITLSGASLRVRASDVAIEHISFRPGLEAEPAERADGLTIGGGSREVKRIRLRNISVSWSRDELTAVADPTDGPVSITHSIFAEALRDAGHPKGRHSMGLLVRDAPRGVTIAGNLFVSNAHRNPVLGSDVRALVKNNWIVNPRFNAMHVYLDDHPENMVAFFENNVMTPGQDTFEETRPLNLQSPDELAGTGATLISTDNTVLMPDDMAAIDFDSPGPAARADANIGTKAVPSHVVQFAGARPLDRNPTDRRIIEDVFAGSSAIVDVPPEDVVLPSSKGVVVPPEDAFALTERGNTRVEVWLEELHLELGGVAGFEFEPLNG
ncbi:MAG: hypothetical protein AAF830_15400 [Pseudomonadota bacterium]